MGFDAADVNVLLAPLDETFFRRIYTDLRLGFLTLWALGSKKKMETRVSTMLWQNPRLPASRCTAGWPGRACWMTLCSRW
jgi:hypothetical protein